MTKLHYRCVGSPISLWSLSDVCCRWVCFSTAPLWFTSSLWASSKRWKTSWKLPEASTNEEERRPGRLWASMWLGRYWSKNTLLVCLYFLFWISAERGLWFRSQAFKRGGRPGAQKVMIVITDGESHDSPQLQQVVADSERDNITMYAIAVSPQN